MTRNRKGQQLAWTRFQRYIAPGRSEMKPRELTPEHVHELREDLECIWELSPATIAQVLSDLRCFLRWAAHVGLVERSPFPPDVMPRLALFAHRRHEIPPRPPV